MKEGSRRSKRWSQTAITRGTLHVFLQVIMGKLIKIFCPNLHLSTVLLAMSAQFTYLHYITYAFALCKQRPPCTATSTCHTSLCIWLTHECLPNFPDHPDQMLLDKEATIKPETNYVVWIGRIGLLRPTYATNCPCGTSEPELNPRPDKYLSLPVSSIRIYILTKFSQTSH